MQTQTIETLTLGQRAGEIVRAFGLLWWAAERGVTSDLFDAYKRLLSATGREINQDTTPRTQLNGKPLIPFAMVSKGDRLILVESIIGPIQRFIEYELHWDAADSLMKGWALAETNLNLVAQERALAEAKQHRIAEEYGDEEACMKAAEDFGERAARFAPLSIGENWVKQ